MMKPYLAGGIVLSALLLGTPCQAALSWSSQVPANAEVKKESGSGHGHGSHGRAKSFYLSSTDGVETEIWFPTLVKRPLHANENGEVKVGGTGVQNYHLLYAKKKSAKREELALRYHYMNGKPTGESPRKLIAYRKGALDIVPSPLTREHQRYQSGKPASYTVLFKNRPLSSHEVLLSTSNGSSVALTTDLEGKFTVTLPDDFSDIKPGRRANKPAEFLLTAQHEETGKSYHTTLSADYHVNPSNWRSSSAGMLVMMAGFVGGLGVIRRQRKRAQESDNA